MLKKLFLGSSPKFSQPISAPKPTKKSQEIGYSDQPDTLSSQIVQADSERQLYKFEAPTQERGLTDFISSHQSGNRFQYVALTGSDVESHSSRIRRLIQTNPKMSKTEIPVKDIPKLKLREDIEKFPLKSTIPVKGKEFINLNKATVIFTPLTSFTDSYSVMKVSLMDMRKRSNQERSSVKSNTNIQCKMEFSLDYCIPREAADQIFLLVARENQTMEIGHMWGVIQVQLEIIESDFPFMENLRETVAMLGLPSSGLETFETDPMHLDITMHENHRKKLKVMYEEGDVNDETEPMKQKTAKITYAKSSVAKSKGSILKAPKPSPFDPQSEWEFMKQPRNKQIADDEVSIEPPEDDASEDEYSDGPDLKKVEALVEDARKKSEKRISFNTLDV